MAIMRNAGKGGKMEDAPMGRDNSDVKLPKPPAPKDAGMAIKLPK